MNLENDPSAAVRTSLRRAMHRESPPAGFADRVMQRIDRREARVRPVWWRAAAASVTLAAILGGVTLHEVRRREGERAKEQVLRAMSIASEKVRYAQQQVRDIGSH